jgi:hypothetical protein
VEQYECRLVGQAKVTGDCQGALALDLIAEDCDGREIATQRQFVERKQRPACNRPPLADKLAANTENSTADRIALQILSVIRPDILGKTPYDDLKRIASGEATRELQEEIARIREKLKEFQCPVCGSDLVASNLVPIDPEEKDWGAITESW